jgi:N-acetylglucosaminyldiphosphoundecaprenol N-acetyl-beta-D-mannosaminyltransferase
MSGAMATPLSSAGEPARGTFPGTHPERIMPASPIPHDHADVLGVKVSAIDMRRALDLAVQWIELGSPGYMCLAGVHGVMEAQRDPELLRAFNRAAMAAPDGMPMTWVGRLQGFGRMDRVFGPDFMLEMCRRSLQRNYRHFLYGGKPGVAEMLRKNLQSQFPGIRIVGTFTPPFRPLDAKETSALVAQVRRARPHIVWVGLSTPKQERFMAQFVSFLGVPLMVGVGAAFDFHTGAIRDCSPWIKRAGLQWLHRLAQEPRRLWKRYLFHNPAFLWLITRQIGRLAEFTRSDSKT